MIQISFVERLDVLRFDTLEDEQDFMKLLDKAHKKAGWASLPRMEFVEFHTEEGRETKND